MCLTGRSIRAAFLAHGRTRLRRCVARDDGAILFLWVLLLLLLLSVALGRPGRYLRIFFWHCSGEGRDTEREY